LVNVLREEEEGREGEMEGQRRDGRSDDATEKDLAPTKEGSCCKEGERAERE